MPRRTSLKMALFRAHGGSWRASYAMEVAQRPHFVVRYVVCGAAAGFYLDRGFDAASEVC